MGNNFNIDKESFHLVHTIWFRKFNEGNPHSTWELRKNKPILIECAQYLSLFDVQIDSYRRMISQGWLIRFITVSAKGFLEILIQISNRQIKLQTFHLWWLRLVSKLCSHLNALWNFLPPNTSLLKTRIFLVSIQGHNTAEIAVKTNLKIKGILT